GDAAARHRRPNVPDAEPGKRVNAGNGGGVGRRVRRRLGRRLCFGGLLCGGGAGVRLLRRLRGDWRVRDSEEGGESERETRDERTWHVGSDDARGGAVSL